VWFVHDGAVIVVGENMAPHLVIVAIWLCMLHKTMVHWIVVYVVDTSLLHQIFFTISRYF